MTGFPVPAALAQSNSQCRITPEAIVNLRPAKFGIPTVWDATYEDEQGGVVEFASGFPFDDGTVMATGEILSENDFKPSERLLIRMNRRHRTLLAAENPVRLNEKAADIIPLDEGFVVSSTFSGSKTERWVKLNWYDAQGKPYREKVFKDPEYDYTAFDLERSVSGDGIMFLVQAVNRSQPEDQYGVLMHLTKDGKTLWKRAYRPGIPNLLDGITPIPAREHYLAFGRIRADDGRDAAWLIELTGDGGVSWQRTYPRGKASIFHDAQVAQGGYILTGDAEPLDRGQMAGWTMKVMPLGEPLWQRYFRAKDLALSGVGSIVQEDGRVSVALNARAVEGTEQKPHVRLLTLNPRGVLMEDQPYIEGRRATAAHFFPGYNGERIVIANTVARPHEEEAEGTIKLSISGATDMGPVMPENAGENQGGKEEEEDLRMQGWYLVATPLDPYEDPCIEESVFQGAP